jgi:Methylase-associated X1
MSESGRSYAQRYERVQRRQHHAFFEDAVARSGGRVLFASGPDLAPLFLGIEDDAGQRVGICAYVFLANRRVTKNRPADEHRLQVRYGDVNSAAWRSRDHPVGFDPLGVDVTIVVGVHPEADLIVGLDPLIYTPLPIGISVFFKDAQINEAKRSGWHVWERDNISGVRRASPRTELGVETLVAFSPNRLLDYVRFERAAQALHLEPPLRFRAAVDGPTATSASAIHALEGEFSLSAQEILDIIRERPRLGMAVRGGVAERHLYRLLRADPAVTNLRLGQQEGPPDLFVDVAGVGQVTVECKNASPTTYADGTPKVETQKTRASKGDPKSRYYEPAQFDVVAACMYGPWRRWEFRYRRSGLLARDNTYADRIAAIQRIDSTWSTTLLEALTS